MILAQNAPSVIPKHVGQIQPAWSPKGLGDNDIVPLNVTSRLQYQKIHRGLTALLYRHDPIGLAAAGAPKDEYEPEAGSIIPRLKDANSAEDVRRIVH